MTAHPDPLAALAGSVRRLADLVRPLDDDALAGPAYPSEWSIAQVVSHLGSGATIWVRRLADGLAGVATPEDLNETVWAEWDAKPPRAQADEGLAADAELLAFLEGLGPDDRARVRAHLAGQAFSFDGFVRLRLNEHLVHTWDVAVALDPGATLASDGTAVVIDNLELIARFSGRGGEPAVITVATTDPARRFEVTITPDGTTLTPSDAAEPDLTLPSEAFIRLVYGRLDEAHTPPVTGTPNPLTTLPTTFPGF